MKMAKEEGQNNFAGAAGRTSLAWADPPLPGE